MDAKWPVIAARSGVKVGIVSAIAWALLDYASQHDERGTVTGFDTEVYAVYSGFPEDEIIAVIQAMTDKGIIVDGKLANWEKRQPKREDDSRDRVTKYRTLKRNVTQGNAPDKDTDTDNNSNSSGGGGEIPVFPSIFRLYETQVGVLTPMIAEELKQAQDDYQQDWIEAAFREAARNNARSWNYIDAILRRWKAAGKIDIGKSKKGGNSDGNKSNGADNILTRFLRGEELQS